MNRGRKSSHRYQYRIAFLGASCSGKTSILNQLVWKRFSSEYFPTLEMDLDYVTDHEGHTYVCLLMDTCGRDEFPVMKRLVISKSNAFLVVFALDDPTTFEYAKRTINDVIAQKKKDKHVNIILVGNKSDLIHDIYPYEAKQYAESITSSVVHCRYMEVSAKDQDDVINLFHSMLDMITVQRIPMSRGSFRRLSFKKHQKPMLIRGYSEMSPPQTMELKRRLSFKKNQRRFSEVNIPQDYSNEFGPTSSEPINISVSPSLFSLNSFSSDDDLDNLNYVKGEEQIKKGFLKLINQRKKRDSPKSV